jgi:septal ring factor EnvC (AmiA/AmiB activator)
MLANKIDSFCQLTHDFNTNFPIKQELENQVSNQTHENLQTEKNKQMQNIPNQLGHNVKSLTVDAEKITTLLTQLNDLENLLHATKNELAKIENSQDFGYSEKLRINLHEYEMPLNTLKVIDREHGFDIKQNE